MGLIPVEAAASPPLRTESRGGNGAGAPHLILNTFIFLNVYNPNDFILEEKVLRKNNNHLKISESAPSATI